MAYRPIDPQLLLSMEVSMRVIHRSCLSDEAFPIHSLPPPPLSLSLIIASFYWRAQTWILKAKEDLKVVISEMEEEVVANKGTIEQLRAAHQQLKADLAWNSSRGSVGQIFHRSGGLI
jgi:hypothetical protein